MAELTDIPEFVFKFSTGEIITFCRNEYKGELPDDEFIEAINQLVISYAPASVILRWLKSVSKEPANTTAWVLWEFVEEYDSMFAYMRHRAHYIDAFESKAECLAAKALLLDKSEFICAPVGLDPDNLYLKLLRDQKGEKGTIRDKDANTFRRVHVGGHHEVYCNGKSHVRIKGSDFGSCRISKERQSIEIEMFSCDCSDYR